MGASYVHNFLGDTVITPPEHQPYYTEKLVYLAGVFLATSTATTNPETLTWDPNLDLPRAGLDLPTHEAVLMCNFNAFYKIHPRQMDIWKDVLLAHPNTVLVLPTLCLLCLAVMTFLVDAAGTIHAGARATGQVGGPIAVHRRFTGTAWLGPRPGSFHWRPHRRRALEALRGVRRGRRHGQLQRHHHYGHRALDGNAGRYLSNGQQRGPLFRHDAAGDERQRAHRPRPSRLQAAAVLLGVGARPSCAPSPPRENRCRSSRVSPL